MEHDKPTNEMCKAHLMQSKIFIELIIGWNFIYYSFTYFSSLFIFLHVTVDFSARCT